MGKTINPVNTSAKFKIPETKSASLFCVFMAHQNTANMKWTMLEV